MRGVWDERAPPTFELLKEKITLNFTAMGST